MFLFITNPVNIITSETDEIVLVREASKGSCEAFGELVKMYEKMVYNVVYQTIRNPDDAYDVSQEVFIKAFKAMKSFRGDCKFSTWLYKICKNASKDYIRKKSKHRTVSLTDYSEEDDFETGSGKPPVLVTDSVNDKPDDAYELTERQNIVREAISQLSDDHRTVVLLRDIEGYSYEDISQMLEIEIGTVKSRLNRARLAIKDYLINRNIL